ncbi:MAG: hypothetical protein ACT6RN_27095 [Agrobacterium sp.]|uniref:hypothetical protein n=1 Tax=Agrobacterium sp. TaxID=361 RepID=UPI0040377A11
MLLFVGLWHKNQQEDNSSVCSSALKLLFFLLGTAGGISKNPLFLGLLRKKG